MGRYREIQPLRYCRLPAVWWKARWLRVRVRVRVSVSVRVREGEREGEGEGWA